MNSKRTLFLLLGVIFLLNGLIINGASMYAGQFPGALMAFAMAVMSFCLAYLSPHFAAKDERAQAIRERAVYISYFWGVGFAILLMLLFNPMSPLQVTAFHALSMFMAFYISVVFLSMVYYAKKY